MNIKSLLATLFGLVVVVSATQQASAQVPRNLTVQGILTDSTSRPVPDGIHTITLRLYDKLLGGNIVYVEEYTTPIFKGLFNLTLGTKSPLPASLVFNKQYFVGISCDGNSEIARIPLSSVPYSLMAETVPDGSITTNKIADGSITLEKLSTELRTEKKINSGLANSATGLFAFIGGGDNNNAAGNYSSVVGGFTNKALANFSIAAGGHTNTANALYATVSGGSANTASANNSTIGGGLSNTSNAISSTISGGVQNLASGTFSAITGGNTNTSSGSYSSIIGGQSNTASTLNSVIGGGLSNSVSGNYGAILGGASNKSSGIYSFVGGGLNNTASGAYSVIPGGNGNTASGNNSSVNGGVSNNVSGESGAIVGGSNNNVSATGGIAIGNNISINNSASGAIVIGGGATSTAKLTSSTANSLSVGFGSSIPTFFVEKASTSNGVGRVGIGNTNPTTLLDLSGTVNMRGTSPIPAVSPAGQGRIYFDQASGKFKGSENGRPYVDLIGGEGGGGGGGWQLTGNAGIVQGTNFLGPTNNVYLDLRAGDGQSGSTTRLRLNTNSSIQRDNGGDTRGDEAIDLQSIRDFDDQIASGYASVITGGINNRASGELSVIGGGIENATEGVINFIGGGGYNEARGGLNSVVGGIYNFTSFDVQASSILGGANNEINGYESGVSLAAIVGGEYNMINGNNSVILGGSGLTLSGFSSLGFHANHFPESPIGDRDMEVADSRTVVFGNMDLWLANNDGLPRSLRFYGFYDNDGIFPNGTNFVAFKAPNNIPANVTWTLPNADGSDGQFLKTNGSGALSWASTGLAYFTESQSTNSPNNSRYVSALSAIGDADDIDIALTPKGNGALTAQTADNTATGGNKRGINSVDWQTKRTASNQVASGSFSTIGGGQSNRATSINSTVAGGSSNSATTIGTTIGGGDQNTASGQYTTVAGGQLNTASNGVATVGGGLFNTASGFGSTIAGGINNIAGSTSAIPGGRALALSSNSFGYNANMDSSGQGVRPMSIAQSNVAVFNNVEFWLTNNDNTVRSLRFYEQYNAPHGFPSGTHFVGFKAPDAIPADVTYTLPNTDGSAGDVLTTNGSATLSWTPPAIPCGGIIMWSGDGQQPLPTGWVLCDGSNGTPDLRGRFVRGANNLGEIGTIGGNETHSHNVNNHNHGISNISGGGNGSSSTEGASGFVNLNVNTTDITYNHDVPDAGTTTTTVVTGVSVSDDMHSHGINSSVSVTSSGSTDDATGVTTQDANHLPPYYVIAYIMRVCN